MRSLNLDQLRTLLEVVELGNFSAAARRLNLTQPADQPADPRARTALRRAADRTPRQAGACHGAGPRRWSRPRAYLPRMRAADAAMRRFRDGWVGRVQIATTLTAHDLPAAADPARAAARASRHRPRRHQHGDARGASKAFIQNKIDFALVTCRSTTSSSTITPLCAGMLVAIFPAGTRTFPDEITPEYAARQPLLVEQPPARPTRW